MYEALCDKTDYGPALLLMLGLGEKDFGRFRDAYLSPDGEQIIVYTRNGGGNREYYQDVFDTLSKHPNYLRDEDDDFDETYASIYFSVPDEFKKACKEMAPRVDTRTGAEKFEELFLALESDFEGTIAKKEKLRNFTESFEQLVTSNAGSGVYTIQKDGTLKQEKSKHE